MDAGEVGARPPLFVTKVRTCGRELDPDEMTTVEQIWDVVEPYLAAEQLELDDLELIGRGPSRTLRVVLDTPDGRPDLDRISEVSRGLSRLLDNATELEGPYQLEVSSPGLERKLSRQSHYQKSLGREVVVKTASGTLRGVLTKADEADFALRTETDEPTIPYQQVVSARTVFRWEPAPKPGQAKGQS